mmetsp:Transcript_55526/g.130011  ORF Transcript_55526/g.130011 Transcript_55526/m.130011 type:complete len:157 (-) Transcript_55526:19-489(-)
MLEDVPDDVGELGAIEDSVVEVDVDAGVDANDVDSPELCSRMYRMMYVNSGPLKTVWLRLMLMQASMPVGSPELLLEDVPDDVDGLVAVDDSVVEVDVDAGVDEGVDANDVDKDERSNCREASAIAAAITHEHLACSCALASLCSEALASEVPSGT